jgi:hypothetical protein
MTGAISQVQGQFLEYPGSLERFEEPDTNDIVPAAPRSSSPTGVGLVALTGADMLEAIQVFFSIRGGFNAFTGALSLSPFFPYNFVQTLRIPYQSGSLTMGGMDAHLWWVTNVLRANNQQFQAEPYTQQTSDAVTGYSPEANLVSSALYTAPAADSDIALDFNIDIYPALYFDRFYDLSTDGKMLRFDQTYVSPFLMSSTGRNVIPTIVMNPVAGAAGPDASGQAPLVWDGVGAPAVAPVWTDTGSNVRFKRRGWRQPVNAALMPPLFNWAHQWFVQRNALSTNRVQIPIPVEGQLLCVILRMFDAEADAPIPLSDLSTLKLTYGSGLNKFFDRPQDHQDRIFRQHGFRLTEGLAIWDMYADTMSNIHGINTYNTASPLITLDFGSSPIGAGSYVDVAMEFLTLVGN